MALVRFAKALVVGHCPMQWSDGHLKFLSSFEPSCLVVVKQLPGDHQVVNSSHAANWWSSTSSPASSMSSLSSSSKILGRVKKQYNNHQLSWWWSPMKSAIVQEWARSEGERFQSEGCFAVVEGDDWNHDDDKCHLLNGSNAFDIHLITTYFIFD